MKGEWDLAVWGRLYQNLLQLTSRTANLHGRDSCLSLSDTCHESCLERKPYTNRYLCTVANIFKHASAFCLSSQTLMLRSLKYKYEKTFGKSALLSPIRTLLLFTCPCFQALNKILLSSPLIPLSAYLTN